MARRPWRVEWLAILVTLLLLAVVLQAGSPGFTLSSDGIWTLAQHFPRPVQRKIEVQQKKARGEKKAQKLERAQAIPRNVDIPDLYLGLYQEHAGDDWPIVAGIYKVESNHGQSHAPGVRSGVNSFGCCAGPGQFNLRGTWQSWRPRPSANVYDPRDSVPATVAMLHHYRDSPIDRTCPNNYGLTARWVNAIRHYNNACWYVRDIAAWAHAYAKAPARIIFTKDRGCDPAKDWKQNLLAPEVRGFMLKLAGRFSYRVSCGATGHSRNVKGTDRQSAHWSGHAFDVDQVQGQAVSPSASHTEFGKMALALGAKQVGGPVDLCPGRRCFTDTGHREHWHVQP